MTDWNKIKKMTALTRAYTDDSWRQEFFEKVLRCPVVDRYYRVCKTPEEFAQDLLVFGTAVIEVEKELKDYEAYKNMHDADGIVGESVVSSDL